MNTAIISENKAFIKKYKSKNLDIVSGTIFGNRKENNDVIKIDNINDSHIFLLADGHGGNYISKIVCNKILYNYLRGFKFNDYKKCKKLYKIIDREIYKQYYCKNFKREGTTLTCIIIHNDTVIAINLGDSNYLIKSIENYIVGSIHRLNNTIEINRVISNKYRVIKIGTKFRIGGKLELSRSFGDFEYKLVNNKYCGSYSAVTCLPCYKKLNTNFKFILIASDGFWDYVSKKETLRIITNSLNIISLSQIIEKLIKTAIIKGSNDNISLIIIKKRG